MRGHMAMDGDVGGRNDSELEFRIEKAPRDAVGVIALTANH